MDTSGSDNDAISTAPPAFLFVWLAALALSVAWLISLYAAPRWTKDDAAPAQTSEELEAVITSLRNSFAAGVQLTASANNKAGTASGDVAGVSSHVQTPDYPDSAVAIAALDQSEHSAGAHLSRATRQSMPSPFIRPTVTLSSRPMSTPLPSLPSLPSMPSEHSLSGLSDAFAELQEASRDSPRSMLLSITPPIDDAREDVSLNVPRMLIGRAQSWTGFPPSSALGYDGHSPVKEDARPRCDTLGDRGIRSS